MYRSRYSDHFGFGIKRVTAVTASYSFYTAAAVDTQPGNREPRIMYHCIIASRLQYYYYY